MFTEPAGGLSRADPRRRRVPVPRCSTASPPSRRRWATRRRTGGSASSWSRRSTRRAVVPTRDLTVDGPHGPVPVRVYGDSVDRGADRPALLWIHGGALHVRRPRHARGRLDRARDLRADRRRRGQRRLPARGRRRAPPGAPRRLRGGHPLAARLRPPSSASTRPGSPSAAPAPAATWPSPPRSGSATRTAGSRPRCSRSTPCCTRRCPSRRPRWRRCSTRCRRRCGSPRRARRASTPTTSAASPADGYAFPALADLGGLARRCWSPPSTTTCAPPARRSPTCSRAAGVDVRLVQADGMLHGFLNLSATLGPVDDVLHLMAETVTDHRHPSPRSRSRRPCPRSTTRPRRRRRHHRRRALARRSRQQGVEVVLRRPPHRARRRRATASRSRATRSRRSTRSGIYDRLAERGFPFSHLRMKTADGHVIAEIPTPPMGGPDLPGTMGAVRGDIADILAEEVVEAGVDVRLGTTRHRASTTTATRSTATLSDGTPGDRRPARRRRRHPLQGPRDDRHRDRAAPGRHGHLAHRRQAARRDGLLRALLRRPEVQGRLHARSPTTSATRSCSRRTSTAPSSARAPTARCSRSAARGTAASGARCATASPTTRSSTTSGSRRSASTQPWYRGRTIIIGDAAHACPPLIAQGAAMCAEDAVVLAEMLTSGDERRGRAAGVHGAPLPAREDGARQQPHRSPSGRSTRRPPAPTRPDHGPDPGRAGRARLMALPLLGRGRAASTRPGSTGSSTGG